MMFDYHDHENSTSLQLAQFQSIVELDENQFMKATPFNRCIYINEDINNENILYHQSIPSLYPISVTHTQEYSLLNNIIQSNNDSDEFSFNPKEWLIVDSTSRRLRAPRQNEFLYLLLERSWYSPYLTWLNKNEGLFKIHDPERVAKLWSKVKNRKTNGIMNYDTFARGLRFYYKSGSMIKTHKKHTFRFKIPLNSIF
ncbi:unnamed protein product [Rotaria sp. Silwood1]|nr:unnamed protein product [Rotaria sp. Silwood1]CAF0837952.1 unnamed protein product [Rotaria sp. Silwood1]CAF3369467.1 unnamed protein product [Rotaria sp. Silwood1]CAF3403850.1 unnamed protein product [Rotaria sp. Silwood1]CAF4606956.1 unnamed protein product [Rotaria sp. Silwood1]